MNVILLEKVGKLGSLGDKVTVKSGYGRNFLIPFGKAVPANDANVAEFETRRAELEKAAAEKVAEAEARAAKLNEIAVNPLIMCLAKIGDNQHKTVPEKEFLKDSYPLPRDIASRTLTRIGKKAIPELLKELKTKDTSILSELIDTIGHINFNSKTENIYEPLKYCYNRNETEDLIKWKIIRAFSGISESEELLKELNAKIKNKRLKKEIERSVRLIEMKKASCQQRTELKNKSFYY